MQKNGSSKTNTNNLQKIDTDDDDIIVSDSDNLHDLSRRPQKSSHKIMHSQDMDNFGIENPDIVDRQKFT